MAGTTGVPSFNGSTYSFNTQLKKYIDEQVAAAFTPGTAVADLAASTNITAVPGSFADVAAVQAYLAGANVIPNIETRLDNLEAKVNAALGSLRVAGIIAT